MRKATARIHHGEVAPGNMSEVIARNTNERPARSTPIENFCAVEGNLPASFTQSTAMSGERSTMPAGFTDW